MPGKYTVDPYYDSPAWRNLRVATLKRDNHICQYCGAKAHQADHVIPRSKSGPDHLSNLVAACRTCNKVAGGSLFVSFAAKKAWILEHRATIPKEPRLPVPLMQQVGKGVTVRRLTGLRKRLALRNRPPHLIDAELLTGRHN